MPDFRDSVSYLALFAPRVGFHLGNVIGQANISGVTLDGKLVSEVANIYEGAGFLITQHRYRSYTATYSSSNGIVSTITANLACGTQPFVPDFT